MRCHNGASSAERDNRSLYLKEFKLALTGVSPTCTCCLSSCYFVTVMYEIHNTIAAGIYVTQNTCSLFDP
jgi:hypothetical protein